jgi:hypothetical protein
LIQTGRKLLLSLSIFIVLHGCGLFNWDKEYDYYYRIHLGNNTNDILLVVLNDSVINSSIFKYTLFPHEINDIHDGRNINEGEDI